MKHDFDKYYREEMDRAKRIALRHKGIDPDAETQKPKSKPLTNGPCIRCGRKTLLTSSSKCVACHTAQIAIERKQERGY